MTYPDVTEISKQSRFFKLLPMSIMMVIHGALQFLSALAYAGEALGASIIAGADLGAGLLLSYLLFLFSSRSFKASKHNRFFGMIFYLGFLAVTFQLLAFFLHTMFPFISLMTLLFGIFSGILITVSFARIFTNNLASSVPIWVIGTGGALLYALRVCEISVLAILASCAFVGAIGLLFYINRSVGSSKFPKPTDMFRRYLEYRLAGHPESMESLFTSLSVVTDVSLTGICLERAKTTISLLNTGIHFGPFNSIGSSALPSEAYAYARQRTGQVVLLTHPFSSHEMDLPSKAEAESLLNNSFGQLMMKGQGPSSRMTPFFQARAGDYIVRTAVCGDMAIVFVDCLDPTVDDIPREIFDQMCKGNSTLGIGAIYDIDSHSNIAFPTPGKSTPVDGGSILKAYRDSVMEALRSPQYEVKVGFGNVALESRLDIGPVGISTVLLEFGQIRQAIIICDGNNMVKGLADKIRQQVKGLGIADAIVITDDNHLLTGVYNVQGGYYPVGSKEEVTVVERALIATKESIFDLSECRVRTLRADIGQFRVLGNSLNEITLATLESLRRFKLSLVSYAMYVFFLSALGASLAFR